MHQAGGSAFHFLAHKTAPYGLFALLAHKTAPYGLFALLAHKTAPYGLFALELSTLNFRSLSQSEAVPQKQHEQEP
jgi:hypothetical protein